MARRAGVMRAVLRRVPVACVLLLLVGLWSASARICTRHVHELAQEASTQAPGLPLAYGDQVELSARFESTIVYTSLDAPGAGEATERVAWDDSWFTADEATYNHELAHASSVLAALAYSESGHYQARAAAPAYMENALLSLGFDAASTESYRFRSEVVDEVLNLITDDADGVAYTIARKHLAPGAEGGSSPRDLIMVSVRGSYGSEWLSNLDLSPSESDDHGGYARAAGEICDDLDGWVAESKMHGAEVSVLLTGHSRGGAVANLVAAQVDDLRAGQGEDGAGSTGGGRALARADRVYAYTFASPATTLSPRAHDRGYANIFNIANPSDIMPYLPLAEWGYVRYGVDVPLPSIDDEGFGEDHARMRDAYERSVGVACGADPADKHVVEAVLSEISTDVRSVRELVTPWGAMRVFASAAANVDPVRILYSHYPSTYIAWMRALDA